MMRFSPISPKYRILLLMMAVGAIIGCSAGENQTPPAPVPEIQPGVLAGYLPREALPDSLALVPPPAAEGSAAFELDQEISRIGLALRDTARWTLAAQDAELMFPKAAGTFSCALGIPITQQDTPHLYALMRRTLIDAGLSTNKAKKHYQRKRPFLVNHQPICTPEEEAILIKNGSYPSGHTATGWAWALILTEIAPDRAEEILARGRAFGESRIVCNVHWNSDVVEGRIMGAATVARLHADPVFCADLEAAKKEYAAARDNGLTPSHDCESEAETLAIPWQTGPVEAEILESWQGDFPLNQLQLLPVEQRQLPVGFFDTAGTFAGIWKVLKPNEDVPKIDFTANLVLFARNTQFFNRISIGKVHVKNGVAEVLAMETMSAMPLENRAAMSLAVVPRTGINAIQAGDKMIPVNKIH